MRTTLMPGGLAIFLAMHAGAGLAADPPADASFSPRATHRTLEPRVVVNSGRLDWVAHPRDLTPWVTLSPLDDRSASRARKVKYHAPLNGDPTRGKHLAGEWCAVCHVFPGDDWPGSPGTPLTHYGRFRYEDAKVFQQIFDARVYNPSTIMPPFGTHGLLPQQDIRDLVAYLQSLR
ncbi:MAG: sulfur oxidation c-type cytochrome SoxX [Thiobacillus sp.]|nr:sulfur oxidation c-type cytochrome SoxX [Thiobacillus sp.]